MSRTLRLHRSNPGVTLHTITELHRATLDARFLDDAGRIAAALCDDELLVLETSTGRRQAQRETTSLHGTVLATHEASGHLAVGGLSGHTWLFDAHLEPITMHEARRETTQLAFSCSGHLAVGHGPAITLVDPAGRVSWSRELPSTAEAVAFSSSGREVAAAAIGLARRWRTEDGGDLGALQTQAPPAALSFSPGDRRLACVTALPGNPGVRVFTIEGPRATRQLGGFTRKPRSLAWSPDGRLLATSGATGLLLWTVDAESVEPVHFGADEPVTTLVASKRSSSCFATASAAGVVSIWSPGESSRPVATYQFAGALVSLGFSVDDRWLIAADEGGTLGLFSVALGSPR